MSTYSHNLKVLTLNCWSIPIPFICKKRTTRINAIANELAKGEYDIVALQEIWSPVDYKKILTRVSSVLPYTHFFYSGMIGSGICIFSKYPILQTFQHRFELNGYAHKLKHCDWFGGKLVGLCCVQVNEMNLNVYATHTHAEYKPEEYYAHRLTQAFHLSQFVKITSDACDAVLLMGDFNFRPTELGFKIILANANLQDAWMNKREKDNQCEETSDRPDNSFTSKKPDRKQSSGKRLDYILFRNNTGVDIQCLRCYTTMHKIANTDINYSDHEGVAADITIKRNVTAMAPQRDTKSIEHSLTEALPLLDEAETRARGSKAFHIAVLLLTLVAFMCTVSLSYFWMFQAVCLPLLTLVGAYSFWTMVVLIPTEINGLKATRKDINNVLKSNGMF